MKEVGVVPSEWKKPKRETHTQRADCWLAESVPVLPVKAPTQ